MLKTAKPDTAIMNDVLATVDMTGRFVNIILNIAPKKAIDDIIIISPKIVNKVFIILHLSTITFARLKSRGC